MTQDGVRKPSLELTEGQSPLRRFKGNLKEYKLLDKKDEQSGREYSTCQFDFTDVEVLETVEPYPYPVATINIGYNPKVSTRWGGFAKSVRRLVPGASIDVLVGKRQEWAMLPYAMRAVNRDTNEWEDAEVAVWQVVSIEGVAAPENLNGYIANIADGKVDKDIYQALFQDQKIIQRPEIVTAITDRKLLDTLVTAGLLTRDTDGVYHKVAQEATV